MLLADVAVHGHIVRAAVAPFRLLVAAGPERMHGPAADLGVELAYECLGLALPNEELQFDHAADHLEVQRGLLLVLLPDCAGRAQVGDVVVATRLARQLNWVCAVGLLARGAVVDVNAAVHVEDRVVAVAKLEGSAAFAQAENQGAVEGCTHLHQEVGENDLGVHRVEEHLVVARAAQDEAELGLVLAHLPLVLAVAGTGLGSGERKRVALGQVEGGAVLVGYEEREFVVGVLPDFQHQLRDDQVVHLEVALLRAVVVERGGLDVARLLLAVDGVVLDCLGNVEAQRLGLVFVGFLVIKLKGHHRGQDKKARPVAHDPREDAANPTVRVGWLR